ncbi:MAG: hypothetical protein ACHQ52_13145 [Candidatus Eisenbacteria bacterium]
MNAIRSTRLAIVVWSLAGAVALAGGCASTDMTDTWRDPAYAGAPSKNLLVISMAKDPAHRRLAEDTFVAALVKRGATATPSYAVFPGGLPDTQTVKQTVREKGYDAVLVTHRISSENVERIVPPTTANVPVASTNPYGYYQTYFEEIHTPGYVETDRVVKFQTDMWIADGHGGRLVWIGRSESVNPGSAQDLSRELAGKVVPELAKRKLVQ